MGRHCGPSSSSQSYLCENTIRVKIDKCVGWNGPLQCRASSASSGSGSRANNCRGNRADQLSEYYSTYSSVSVLRVFVCRYGVMDSGPRLWTLAGLRCGTVECRPGDPLASSPPSYCDIWSPVQCNVRYMSSVEPVLFSCAATQQVILISRDLCEGAVHSFRDCEID